MPFINSKIKVQAVANAAVTSPGVSRIHTIYTIKYSMDLGHSDRLVTTVHVNLHVLIKITVKNSDMSASSENHVY